MKVTLTSVLRCKEKEGQVTVSSAKLTSKYQITIPAEIRRRLHLEAGDVVYLTEENGRVELQAARGGWTRSTRGLGAEVWRAEGGGEARDPL
jgi:AbrB family looped-hinge helix DNA binding protein